MKNMPWSLKLFIVVFGICPAIMVGAGIWYFYKISTPQKLTSISQITPVVPMKFPPSAQVLDGETVFGPSALYFIAKIKMPRSDLHQFLAQPLINDGLLSTECELTESNSEIAGLEDRFHQKVLGRFTLWRPKCAVSNKNRS